MGEKQTKEGRVKADARPDWASQPPPVAAGGGQSSTGAAWPGNAKLAQC